MTLGPSSSSSVFSGFSLFSLFSVCTVFTVALAVSGCAFGDVSGTGNRDTGSSSGSTESNQPSSTVPESGSRGSTETPAAEDEGPVDYDALFDAPADPTTTDDLVTGLWAGKTPYAETRLRLRASKVVIAAKCGESAATGMEVGAVVTDDQVKILASKTVGSGTYCEIKVSPVAIPRCSAAKGYDCFEVTGTTLSFSGKALFTSYSSTNYGSYTKLSD